MRYEVAEKDVERLLNLIAEDKRFNVAITVDPNARGPIINATQAVVQFLIPMLQVVLDKVGDERFDNSKDLILSAAAESMSPDQYDHVEALGKMDADVYDRFLRCIYKRSK